MQNLESAIYFMHNIEYCFTYFSAHSNELELLGNEVDVCGGGTGMGVFIPSSSGGGACGGSDTGGGAGGGDSNINNFGKYTKENIKNVNLDTKYTADDGYNEKCNLTVNMPSKYA